MVEIILLLKQRLHQMIINFEDKFLIQKLTVIERIQFVNNLTTLTARKVLNMYYRPSRDGGDGQIAVSSWMHM